MKTLLQSAKIYDGSGDEAFYGDILINDDRIEEVTRVEAPIDPAKADKVIDLNGKSLASGFIDPHSHNDWFAIKKDAVPYFEPFIRQGITSFVTGNCGLSAIGFEEGTNHIEKMGGGLFGYRGEVTGVYPGATEFLDAVDNNAPCNIATLVGHCSARSHVAGYENRQLSDDEMKTMLGNIERDLQNGAAGVSLGLMYEPGIYSNIEELKKVAALCVKYNKPLTVHPRAESKMSMSYDQLFGRSHLLRAFDELVEIAKGTNLKLQYSHAIFVGSATWGDKDEFLEIVNKLRAEGVDCMFDIYNETKGVSVITVILPPWYQGMSEEERNKPFNKIKLTALIKATEKLLGFGFKDIEIAYIGDDYKQYEGKTVHELAQEYGKKDLEMYLQLCKESNFKGRVNQGKYTTPEIIHEFENNELCLFMTDAWVEEKGVQNPAIYDCFPKFLQDSLKGLGASMPKTIRRMTGATADRFMIKERGYVKPGYYADLTIFDEDVLKNTEPDKTCSFGIEKVFINGKPVLDGDKLDKEALQTSGKAIRI